MTPQGIQSYLEEKEIVCLVWSLDTVDGWFPDTISLVLPNGMVEIVGSIPFQHHTQSPYAWVWYGSLGFSWNPFSHKMIMMKEMKYIIEFLSFAVLTLVFLYGFTILIVAV